MKDKIAGEWFERGRHDLLTAKISVKGGYPEVILMLVHQALEKYIKGYLVGNGWKLKKIHDLETLFSEAIKYEKKFKKYLDFGRMLTAYYYEDRYPPGPIPKITKKKISYAFKIVEEIVSMIIRQP